jgi:plastocyanin
MTTRRGLAIAGVALALSAGTALATLSDSDRTALEIENVGRHEIQMRGNSFAPRSRTVTVGDTVVWVNSDIVRHNVVRAELFDSGDLRSGERFEWVPADTGTVRYQCTIHQRMRGTVRVEGVR